MVNEALYAFGGLGAVAFGLAAAGALYDAAQWRKALSLGIALALPAVALSIPAEMRVARGVTGILSALGVFKWLQLVLERDEGELSYRVWQFLAPFDVREAKPGPARFDAAMAARVAFGFTLSAGALLALYQTPELAPRALASLLAYLATVLFVVSVADALTKTVRFLHQLLGFTVPPIMDDTFYPESVQAFWGRRWNRTVSRWLFRMTFRPLARRGRPVTGLAASFGVSALIHFYAAWVPLDAKQALLCASFFLLQFPLILIERRFIPTRLRRPFAIIALLLTGPAFILPVEAVLLG